MTLTIHAREEMYNLQNLLSYETETPTQEPG